MTALHTAQCQLMDAARSIVRANKALFNKSELSRLYDAVLVLEHSGHIKTENNSKETELLSAAQGVACASYMISGTKELIALRAAIEIMNSHMATQPLSASSLSEIAALPVAELLQQAARAYGLTGHRYCESRNCMAAYTPQDGYYGPCWNPLKDDGDALRLAVKCMIDIKAAQAMYHDLVGNARYHQDLYASTRDAIVYAVVLAQLEPAEIEL